MYWAWKNLQAEVIGLVHYRRYFERQDFSDGLYHLPIDDILSEAEAEELMERYDIVVPKRRNTILRHCTPTMPTPITGSIWM